MFFFQFDRHVQIDGKNVMLCNDKSHLLRIDCNCFPHVLVVAVVVDDRRTEREIVVSHQRKVKKIVT